MKWMRIPWIMGEQNTMNLQLDDTKARQVAAEILRHYPNHETSRLVLLKMLYLANRRSIEDRGIPMVPDRYTAMDHGPVLSEVYNLIKHESRLYRWWGRAQRAWSECFQNKKCVAKGDERRIFLKSDPGDDRLSKYDKRIIRELFEAFGSSDSKLYEHAHSLPEYAKNEPQPKSANPISLADICQAVGREDVTESILVERQNRWRRVQQEIERVGL